MLLDRGNLEVSSIENLITVCRMALDRIGRRECLDPAFAWLAACKNSLIHLGGVPFDKIFLSIQDVYTPPWYVSDFICLLVMWNGTPPITDPVGDPNVETAQRASNG